MGRAYVGIANLGGLESFLPEDDAVIAAVIGQAQHGSDHQRAFFWAVVADDVVKEIERHLLANERLQALLTLEVLAIDITRLTIHAAN